ncbi:MAG TPA: peptide MFS transporter, partial [Chitinophagaceae bacterium]|nr:peptide MFS transporter [Chitinophagaceae bacterium]
LYGSYTSLVYLTPLLGGFIADKYWGNKRSIVAGGVLMAIGEFILFFCGTVYETAPGLSSFLFFAGLGFMIAGNGFFKPNISSLVGQLYPQNDRRIDPAYTIFYMGINVGGAIGPFICGIVGDTGNPADFRWAFLVAGIGMSLSVLVQKLFQKKYVTTPDGKSLGEVPENAPKAFSNPLFIAVGLGLLSALMIGILYFDAQIFSFLSYLLLVAVVGIIFYIFTDKTLNTIERKKIIVILIVSFFVIFFWSAFEQAGASLTFFADEQTNRQLNMHLPVWIVYLVGAVLLYYIYILVKKVARNLKADDKLLRNSLFLLLALFGAGIAYAILYLMNSGMSHIDLDELPASTFQSLNSIFVVSFAPLFALLWTKLGKREPSSPTKMAMGLMLLALGYWWIAYGVKDVAPTVKVSMIWLTGMYALHTWGELCLSPIGLSLVNKLSPLKFASLLMAVWFLANAAANLLAGALSALYPTDGRVTSFLGYKMSNLHEFFMLFVFMAGAASIILFFLSRYLQKLMNAK